MRSRTRLRWRLPTRRQQQQQRWQPLRRQPLYSLSGSAPQLCMLPSVLMCRCFSCDTDTHACSHVHIHMHTHTTTYIKSLDEPHILTPFRSSQHTLPMKNRLA